MDPDSRRRFLEGLSNLTGAATSSDLELDPEDVPAPHELEAAVLRRRRSYSTMSPYELCRRVDARLGQARRLLGDRWPRGVRLSLLASGSWLTLLRATVLTDLERVEAAETAVQMARALAREAGHREAEAWTWETEAWMAATDGRHRDAFDLATQGMAVAPAGSHGLVAVTMQRARIGGALEDEATALRDLLAGQRAYATVPEAQWPDDHYQLDPAKVAFFASGAFALLRRAAETIEHASEVIRRNEDPATWNWWPTRVANARVEWAMALVDQGQEDEALAMARRAFEPEWLRPDTERRVRRLLGRMRDPRLRARLAGELHQAIAAGRESTGLHLERG
jgi:hypothetical protein